MGCYSHHLNKASSKKVPPRLVCTEQHKIERTSTYGYNSRDGYQHRKAGARSVLPHHRPGPRRDMVLGCTGIHYSFSNPVHNRQARLGYFPGPVATHLLAPCPIPQAIEPFKVVLFKKQWAVLNANDSVMNGPSLHLIYVVCLITIRPYSLHALWKCWNNKHHICGCIVYNSWGFYTLRKAGFEKRIHG